MRSWQYALVVGMVTILTGCGSTPPSPDKAQNICELFTQYPDWHKAAEASRDKWRVPPQILMAIIYQESGFKSNAKPPMDHFLGIPTGRASSAYGYPQAKDEVWSDYERSQGVSASRSNMADSLDFMGWYLDQAQKRNGVSKWDPYALYLNYHEGWGGYARQTYSGKTWLLGVANKVKALAEQYGAQYAMCRDSL